MLKNGSKDFKEKIKFLLLLVLVVLSKVFFESIENGITEPKNIILAAAAGFAFSVYIIKVLTKEAFNLFTVQSLFAIITLVLTLGVVISHRLISAYSLCSVLLASVMLLLAQHFYLLPVAAVLSVGIMLLENRPEIQSITMSCVPSVIGISCVCLSEELKKSAVWKKIVFAVSNLIMIASAVKVFYIFRFTVTVHSFVIQIWDSFASFAAIIILAVLAVWAIKTKKSIGEIFGYIVVAAFGIVPTFMEMKYVFVSAMAMFMMLTACAKDGMTADVLFDTAADFLKSKAKKN